MQYCNGSRSRRPCPWRHGATTAHPWGPGWSWSIVVCGKRGSGPRPSRLADLWETRLHLESWFCNKKKQTKKLNNDPVWNYFQITFERMKRKSWLSGILNDLWENTLTLQNRPVTIYTAKIINIHFRAPIYHELVGFWSSLCLALDHQEWSTWMAFSPSCDSWRSPTRRIRYSHTSHPGQTHLSCCWLHSCRAVK